MTVANVKDIMRELFLALDHMHSHKVIHRDIKPLNVIYNLTDGVLKLTDFDLALLEDVKHPLEHIFVGTPSFNSPETFHHRYTVQAFVPQRVDCENHRRLVQHLVTGPHIPREAMDSVRSTLKLADTDACLQVPPPAGEGEEDDSDEAANEQQPPPLPPPHGEESERAGEEDGEEAEKDADGAPTMGLVLEPDTYAFNMCAVCLKDGTEEPLIECATCRVHVHPRCYGIDHIVDVQELGVRPAKDSRDALHVVAGPLDDRQGEAVHVCDPAVRREGENGWDLRRLTALLERARADGPIGQDEPFELRMTLGKRVLCPKESSAGPLSPPPPQHRLPTTPDKKRHRWRCDVCRRREDPWEVPCELCPRRGGALKAVTINTQPHPQQQPGLLPMPPLSRRPADSFLSAKRERRKTLLPPEARQQQRKMRTDMDRLSPVPSPSPPTVRVVTLNTLLQPPWGAPWVQRGFFTRPLKAPSVLAPEDGEAKSSVPPAYDEVFDASWRHDVGDPPLGAFEALFSHRLHPPPWHPHSYLHLSYHPPPQQRQRQQEGRPVVTVVVVVLERGRGMGRAPLAPHRGVVLSMRHGEGQGQGKGKAKSKAKARARAPPRAAPAAAAAAAAAAAPPSPPAAIDNMTMEPPRALIKSDKTGSLKDFKTGGAGRTKEEVRNDIMKAWGRG
ncbi:unnamed protein product [Vitrella brassicaformis CCMP3155]|uniref:Protein kinase domain-containing protein n=1 Tax=Vitrella brassicaformis (strain CCMP3155) TaxID=1169540 RepID=A0A0G4EKL5_VITBC|nr:unnamed protein product [Vitrella brassicaformis CCMP3155]|eukprot:CEL97075.1 unnamed protein product [Vitrella brassicaformis CCMP3155]